VTHVRDAAALAMLPSDDSERVAAFAHAEGCAQCAAELAKGDKLRALLESAPAPEPPPPAVLARVAAELRAEAGRADRSVGRAVAAAVVLVWIALLVFAHRHAEGASVWIGAVVVGVGAVAAALAGARLGWRIALAVAGASALFALFAGTGDGVDLGPGAACMGSELVAGVVALGVAWVVRSRQGEVVGPGFLGAVAAAGALAGQAALNVTCHVRDALPHLLVFHTGGVIVAALIGAALGAVRRSTQIV
jgi:hypothetical protein